MDYLLGPEEHSLTFSMLTNDHYRALLALDHDIYIGLPATIKNGAITLQNDIHLPNEELKAYRHSARILAEVMK